MSTNIPAVVTARGLLLWVVASADRLVEAALPVVVGWLELLLLLLDVAEEEERNR